VVGTPTAGEGRAGYPQYFSEEEMSLDTVVETLGRQITVSVVAWTDIGQTLPNAYFVCRAGIGGGGNSNQSGNTISGAGGGTDFNFLASEISIAAALSPSHQHRHYSHARSICRHWRWRLLAQIRN